MRIPEKYLPTAQDVDETCFGLFIFEESRWVRDVDGGRVYELLSYRDRCLTFRVWEGTVEVGRFYLGGAAGPAGRFVSGKVLKEETHVT